MLPIQKYREKTALSECWNRGALWIGQAIFMQGFDRSIHTMRWLFLSKGFGGGHFSKFIFLFRVAHYLVVTTLVDAAYRAYRLGPRSMRVMFWPRSTLPKSISTA